MFEIIIMFKVGIVVFVLEMIESGVVFCDFFLDNLICVICEVSYDVIGCWLVWLVGGCQVSVLDIQWEYYICVVEYLQIWEFNVQIEQVVDLWGC